MGKTIDSEPLYTHHYVRGKNGEACTPEDLAACKASLLRCLFGENKVFEDVRASDVLPREPGIINSLHRHPEIVLSAAKITSFATKLFSIPIEHQFYYPGYSESDKVVLALATNVDVTDDSITTKKHKSVSTSILPISTQKLVGKNKTKKLKTIESNVSSHSIMNFFRKTDNSIVPTTTGTDSYYLTSLVFNVL